MKKSYSKSKSWTRIILILFLFTSLYSCKKDNKDNDQQGAINGTTWEWRSKSRNEFLVGSYPDHYNYFNLHYDLYCNQITTSFDDLSANLDIAFIAHYKELDNWAGTQKFAGFGLQKAHASYTYKGKNIILIPELERLAFNFPEQIWTGTVNKNTMDLENVFGASVKLNKLTKKDNADYSSPVTAAHKISSDSDYSLSVMAAPALTANSDNTLYKVIALVENDDYGYTTGSGMYEANSTVRVEVFSDICHLFKNWTIEEDVVSISNPYDFVVTEDVTITAHFYLIDFDYYCPTLWNNTFMLHLKKLWQDGYDVIGCKWYKNGIEELNTRTIDEFSYSAGPNFGDMLEYETCYSFRLITSNRGELCSTVKFISPNGKK